ncbi:ATP-binding protein [Chondromyces apiculatus]|uniref:Schlafen AlbA-2 domain-containing protein n=1 Tax=Chondromyces apiculatus DSM 436 TaxID=1192034 RepID=A0A017TJ15_9BACT|nr:ATP-binding protein [Chondromyces apiculatus]EYF08586.1 Hypothetical protein CAP_4116 [Chondromyces apiculatus DSM 436]
MTGNIEQRLRLGEDARTEFKSVARATIDLKDLAREIVAFANGRGGQIFLGVDDLDLDALDRFLKDAYGPAAPARRLPYLKALQCLDPSGALTVAGVLLFAREPQRWLPDARISAVCFPGTRISGEMKDRHDLDGNLFQQLDAAISFLDRNVAAPARIEGYRREERGIPMPARREAVLNALAHRDYRAASQIRLFVYDDRVEVINPGVLLNQRSLDSIRLGGISQRRNPALAAALVRASRREKLGMGVPEMIGLPEMRSLMLMRGLPEPEIRLEGGHCRVVLRAVAVEGKAA